MRARMRVCGIDPGLEGAMAVVENGKLVALELLTPTLNLGLLSDWLRNNRVGLVGLEKAQAMPGQGVSSMFSYGVGFGFIQGILQEARFPHRQIPPAKWAKWAHQGCAAGLPKARSLEAARRLFPEQTFLASERSKKPHVGLIDAALIAAYLDATHGAEEVQPIAIRRAT
jgi:crossover junction endodeoxyribonuclease RuvC